VRLPALDACVPPVSPRADRSRRRPLPSGPAPGCRGTGGQPGPSEAPLLWPRRRVSPALARAANRRAAPIRVPALPALGRLLAPTAPALRGLSTAGGGREVARARSAAARLPLPGRARASG